MTAELRVDHFLEVFGRAAEAEGTAPGRVNLVGEPIDEEGGYVLPVTLPLKTRVEVARREDSTVEIVTLDPEQHRATYELGAEASNGTWIDYVQGLTAGLAARAVPLGGFSALVRSSVPWGSGLASRSALLIAMARALRGLYGFALSELDLAMLAHWVAHDFMGVSIGVTDPMISCLGSSGEALCIDARTRQFEHIALPPVDLIVIDSGIAQEPGSRAHEARRVECQRAAEMLGVRSLSDVVEVDTSRGLPSPLDRRARHVVTENQRVMEAVGALKDGDLEGLGALFDESHRSRRDDFEASAPEVDALVDDARSVPGVYGARMTGDGFGGAVIALARHGQGAHVARLILEHALAQGHHGTKVLLTGRELG